MTTYTDIVNKKRKDLDSLSSPSSDFGTLTSTLTQNNETANRSNLRESVAQMPNYFNNNTVSNLTNATTSGMHLIDLASRASAIAEQAQKLEEAGDFAGAAALKATGAASKATKVGGIVTGAVSQALDTTQDLLSVKRSKDLSRGLIANNYDGSSADAFMNSVKNAHSYKNYKWKDVRGQSGSDIATGYLSSVLNGAAVGATMGGGVFSVPGAIIGGAIGGAAKATSQAFRTIFGKSELDDYNEKARGFQAYDMTDRNAKAISANKNQFSNAFKSSHGSGYGGVNLASPNVNNAAFGGSLAFDINQTNQNIETMRNLNNSMIKSMPNSFTATNKFAEGGMMTPFHQDIDQGIEIQNGGTHEENPLGGVQFGTDPNGNPNLVEQNEFIYKLKTENGPQIVVFSDRLGYAEKAKKIAEESKERPNDPISQDTANERLTALYQQQEEQKAKEEQQFNPQSYDALQGLQGLQAMQPSMEDPSMQEGMPEEYPQENPSMMGENLQGISPEMIQQMQAQQQPMMAAYGGKINTFDDGGALPNWATPYDFEIPEESWKPWAPWMPGSSSAMNTLLEKDKKQKQYLADLQRISEIERKNPISIIPEEEEIDPSYTGIESLVHQQQEDENNARRKAAEEALYAAEMKKRRNFEGLPGIAGAAAAMAANAMPIDQSAVNALRSAGIIAGRAAHAPSLEAEARYTPMDYNALLGVEQANHNKMLGNIRNLSNGNAAQATALMNNARAAHNANMTQTYLDLYNKDMENRNQVMKYNGEVNQRRMAALNQVELANQQARAKQAEFFARAADLDQRLRDDRENDMGSVNSVLAQNINNRISSINNLMLADHNPYLYDSNGAYKTTQGAMNSYLDSLNKQRNANSKYNDLRGTQIKVGN